MQSFQSRQILRDPFQAAENIAAGFRQHLPGRGQINFLADLLVQRLTRRFRQLFDLDGQRGRGEVEFLSGTRKAHVPCHGIENAQLV